MKHAKYHEAQCYNANDLMAKFFFFSVFSACKAACVIHLFLLFSSMEDKRIYRLNTTSENEEVMN